MIWHMDDKRQFAMDHIFQTLRKNKAKGRRLPTKANTEKGATTTSYKKISNVNSLMDRKIVVWQTFIHISSN